MRDPNAIYDPALNQPDANQEKSAKLVFEFIQELRREASSSDQDSPDELRLSEIIQASFRHVPGVASAIMAMLQDESKLPSDVGALGYVLSRQLGVYGE